MTSDAGRSRGPSTLGRRQLRVALVVGAILVFCYGSVRAQVAASTGTSYASVTLTGEVDLGELLTLGLSTDSLTFDLRETGVAAPACLVSVDLDEVMQTGAASGALFGAVQVLPANTSFRVTTYPAIEVEGGQGTTSGPLPPVDTGASIVCYRTFILEAFSNSDGWQVTVDRFELPGTPVIENLYLAAVCRGEAATGMWVSGDAQVTLLSGRAAGACSEALVVMALKLGKEAAGTSAVGLRYTLMSSGQLGGVQ